jgi:hypothetical protein
MKYEVKNITYQPIRIYVSGREIIIPGRNDIIENSVVVEAINDDIKNLSTKGLLKYRPLK